MTRVTDRGSPVRIGSLFLPSPQKVAFSLPPINMSRGYTPTWVPAMLELVERINEVLARKLYTCYAPVCELSDSSNWPTLLGNPSAAELATFLDSRDTGLGCATHIAWKTQAVDTVDDITRKYMMADQCSIVPQLIARVLRARGIPNVSVGTLRFVYDKSYKLPAMNCEGGYRLLHRVTTRDVASKTFPPHIVHHVLRVDGYAVDLLAATLGNTGKDTMAVWPETEKFEHPEQTGKYFSWCAKGSASFCNLLDYYTTVNMIQYTILEGNIIVSDELGQSIIKELCLLLNLYDC